MNKQVFSSISLWHYCFHLDIIFSLFLIDLLYTLSTHTHTLNLNQLQTWLNVSSPSSQLVQWWLDCTLNAERKWRTSEILNNNNTVGCTFFNTFYLILVSLFIQKSVPTSVPFPSMLSSLYVQMVGTPLVLLSFCCYVIFLPKLGSSSDLEPGNSPLESSRKNEQNRPEENNNTTTNILTCPPSLNISSLFTSFYPSPTLLSSVFTLHRPICMSAVRRSKTNEARMIMENESEIQNKIYLKMFVYVTAFSFIDLVIYNS